MAYTKSHKTVKELTKKSHNYSMEEIETMDKNLHINENIEKEFSKECADRKRTARGIHNIRINGSATGLTPAPLTNSQIKKLNGPVIKWSGSKIYSYSEFKKFPVDIQEKILESYHEKYGVGLTRVAIAMKTKGNTFSCHVKNSGLKLSFAGKVCQLNPEQIKEWDSFVASQNSEVIVEPHEEKKEKETKSTPVSIPVSTNHTEKLTSESWSGSGYLDDMSMLNVIMDLFKNKNVKINVEVIK